MTFVFRCAVRAQFFLILCCTFERLAWHPVSQFYLRSVAEPSPISRQVLRKRGAQSSARYAKELFLCVFFSSRKRERGTIRSLFSRRRRRSSTALAALVCIHTASGEGGIAGEVTGAGDGQRIDFPRPSASIRLRVRNEPGALRNRAGDASATRGR